MIKDPEIMTTDGSVVLSDTEQRFYEILRKIQNNRRATKEDKAMRIGQACATVLVDPEFRLPLQRMEIIKDKVVKGE